MERELGLRMAAALEELLRGLDPDHPTVDETTRRWLLEARADAVRRVEMWTGVLAMIDGLTSTLPTAVA